MAEDVAGSTVPPSGSFPASGRLAGIDYGTVRVGVAITDPERRLASPHAVLTRRDRTQEAR
ncbi:MAG: Holliday junction resolvase RuvX, partial [Planctomycetota bacterium]